MSGNAKDRRKWRRYLDRMNGVTKLAPVAVQPPVVEPSLDDRFPIGVQFRIGVEDYGTSYARVKGTVVGYDKGQIVIQTPRRKAPLVVSPEHLLPLEQKAAA